MPEEATHSSDGEQRGVGGPRPSARGGAAAGKLRMLEKVLEAPVAIAQTADQKMQDHYGARLAESRAKMQDEQLSSFAVGDQLDLPLHEANPWHRFSL